MTEAKASPTDLTAIRELHYPMNLDDETVCGYNGDDWPCHTAQVLAALDDRDTAFEAIFDGMNEWVETLRKMRAAMSQGAERWRPND